MSPFCNAFKPRKEARPRLPRLFLLLTFRRRRGGGDGVGERVRTLTHSSTQHRSDGGVRKKCEYEERGEAIYQNTDAWVINGPRMLAKVSTEMYMVESGEPRTHCAQRTSTSLCQASQQLHHNNCKRWRGQHGFGEPAAALASLTLVPRLASSVVLSASSVDQSIPRVASR